MNYVSIYQFNQGWEFFANEIYNYVDIVNPRQRETVDIVDHGTFPCSRFLCSGCDDWLDARNQNRNDKKL